MKWFLAGMAMLCAACLGPTAHASISKGDDAELMLILWDPVAKVSYTKDLGVSTYFGTDIALNRNSIFVQGQQDAGYQQFWSLDAGSDANYQKFRSVVADAANTVWAVVAVDAQGNPSDPPGSLRLMTTLKSGSVAGLVNPTYTKLKSLNNDDFNNSLLQFATNYIDDQNAGFGNPFNSHRPAGVENFAVNGSSYDTEGTVGYFGKNSGQLSTFFLSCNCTLTNPVGKSSWFYYVSTSSEIDTTLPVSLDEFDNLGHDGYFGLAQNQANGNVVLSYTLQSALASTSAVTAEGRTRASLTELRSGALMRLVAAPAGEFADWCPPVISAVPEPSAWWALAAGGLVLLVVRRRTRANAAVPVGLSLPPSQAA